MECTRGADWEGGDAWGRSDEAGDFCSTTCIGEPFSTTFIGEPGRDRERGGGVTTMALSEGSSTGEEVDAEGGGAKTGAPALDTPGVEVAGVSSADGGADAFSEDFAAAAVGTEVVLEDGTTGGLIEARNMCVYHIRCPEQKMKKMTHHRQTK